MRYADFEITTVFHGILTSAKVPIGSWTLDDTLNEVGLLQRVSIIDSVEPYTLALLTRVLNWSLNNTQALIRRVEWELKDADLRLFCRFHFVYGKKPEDTVF